MSAPDRRLVVTVCLRERGVVTLPVERGARTARLEAVAITRELTALVARRGLEDCVRVREGCAGGCAGVGPNVDVRIYGMRRAEERSDYVYSLAAMPSLAAVIDENLRAPASRRAAR